MLGGSDVPWSDNDACFNGTNTTLVRKVTLGKVSQESEAAALLSSATEGAAAVFDAHARVLLPKPFAFVA